MADPTYAVPDGTEWTDSVGNVWTSHGADVEVAGPGDWLDVAFRIEVRGDPTGGALWDSGQWDSAQWVDPADDDGYDWTDITGDYVKATFKSATRGQFGGQFTPGSAVVTVLNSSGDYTIASPDSVLEIGQILRIVAVHGDTETIKFRGVIKAAPGTDIPGKPRLVSIQVRSPLAAIARQNRLAVSPVGDSESTGDRIARILDSILWPTSLRQIDDGVEWVQATTLEGSALAELQLTALSDGGEVFHDDEGRVVFLDRDATDALTAAAPSFTVAGYPDPGGAGTWITYAALKYGTDVDKVRNHATIGAVGETPFTAIDTASVQEYGMATVVREDLLNVITYYLVPPYEQWPERLAARLVDAYADPAERYVVTLTAGDDSDVLTVLDASILDVVRVRRYAGTTEIDETVQIEGIAFTIQPARPGTDRTDRWSVTLTTGPTI